MPTLAGVPKQHVLRSRTITRSGFRQELSAYRLLVNRPRTITLLAKPLSARVNIAAAALAVARSRTIRSMPGNSLGLSALLVARPRTITLIGTIGAALVESDDIRNHLDRDNKGQLPEARLTWDPTTGHYHDGVTSRPVTGSAGWQDDGSYIRQQTPGDKVVLGSTTPDTLGLLDMAADRLRLRNLLYVENGVSTPTEFTDSSGNGRHAPITGAASAAFGVTDLQASVEDFAVDLNGGTYCDVDAIKPGTSNYSLVYLCKPDTGLGCIWGHFAGGTNGEYIYLNGTTGRIWCDSFGNPAGVDITGFTAGATILLAIVYDATAGQRRIYVNGTQVASTAYTGYVPGAPKLFAVSNGTLPAQGIFDELAWYDRALTVTEITDIQNAYGFGNLQAVLAGSTPWAYYKLNDGASTPGRGGEVGVNPDGIVVRVGTTWKIANYTSTTGSMTNPMTAAGDLIVGGTVGAPTRLGVGVAGQVLTAGATAPTWADPVETDIETVMLLMGA